MGGMESTGNGRQEEQWGCLAATGSTGNGRHREHGGWTALEMAGTENGQHWEHQEQLALKMAGTGNTGNGRLVREAPPGAGSRRAGLAQPWASFQGHLSGAGAGAPAGAGLSSPGQEEAVPWIFLLCSAPCPPNALGVQESPQGGHIHRGAPHGPPFAPRHSGVGLGDFSLFLCINKQNPPKPPDPRLALTPGVAGPQGGVPPQPRGLTPPRLKSGAVPPGGVPCLSHRAPPYSPGGWWSRGMPVVGSDPAAAPHSEWIPALPEGSVPVHTALYCERFFLCIVENGFYGRVYLIFILFLFFRLGSWNLAISSSRPSKKKKQTNKQIKKKNHQKKKTKKRKTHNKKIAFPAVPVPVPVCPDQVVVPEGDKSIVFMGG
ncbi:uncharacterized protein LOC113957177 [Corapipo altera]|uniref:uncharacterized protein LOC113957177 n=1 Tax=Corapipo altera TaxID=415028 RepID=UPI000FD6728A|nr:uncharacterized protein LOC113957177 [Corapipo altera]